MRLAKLNPYLILLALAALLVTAFGCRLFAGYDTAEAPVSDTAYLCSSDISRQLDNTHTFTEKWQAYIYPSDDDTNPSVLCATKRNEYIEKSMSPYFNWQAPLLVAFRDIDRRVAADCTFELPQTAPRGPEEEPPATYGAPVGAALTWEGEGDQPVPAAQAYAEIRLTDADGNLHVATPGIKQAHMKLAERQGALDGPLHEAIYDPEKRHIRVGDFFIELATPFDLGEVHVTELYIQSIGTLISESRASEEGTQYTISIDEGKSKFYFRAVGEGDGHSATDSRCFVNKLDEQRTASFRFYQGEPWPVFLLNLIVPTVGGQLLDLEIRLLVPEDGTLFDRHQPFVRMPNIESDTNEVYLSLIKENLELRVSDHDGIGPLEILWFEDFEQPAERFIGEGLVVPEAQFSPGSHQVTVVVFDESGAYNYHTFTVNVAALPVANDDAYETDEDVILNISAPGVLSNDTDSNGNPLIAVLDTGPGNGDVDLSPDGSFAYTPDPDFNGTDSFTYVAKDGPQVSDAATVTITVNPVNDDPVANDDAYSTNEDTALTVPVPGVLGNDEDVDGDSLTAVTQSGPSNGEFVLNADGSFTYTPAANFFGDDTFTYTVSDGMGGSASATVTITVNPVNDDPVAQVDAYSTDEDTALTVPAPGVLGNDEDVDGDSLTAVTQSGPSNGALVLNADGSFTYTPTPNFFGTDSFSYSANDGSADSNTATVVITVNELSAQQETDRLSKLIDVLLDEGEINDGHANSLQQKLAAILAKLAAEKTNTVCNVYGAFIQQVMALVKGGTLTPEQGQVLIDNAENLMEELGCN